MGHARHRRIPARNRAGEETIAQRSGGAGACARDLGRDAFGLRVAAAGVADEHQGRIFPRFKIWSKAEADIERIKAIWIECLARYKGPFLFGTLSLADAMYAPVVTRFRTYDVKLEGAAKDYAERIWDWPPVVEWREAALAEKEEIEELEVEF